MFNLRNKKMSRSRIAMLLVITLLAVGLSGCLESTKGPSDEELISGLINKSKVAQEAQDIDSMMAAYSKDYQGQNGESIEQVREFLEGMKYQGYLEGTKMDIEEAKISVDGDTGTIEPIKYSGDWGEMQIRILLKKENDGVWRYTASEEYY